MYIYFPQIPRNKAKSSFLQSFLKRHVKSLNAERCIEESSEHKSLHLDNLVVKKYALKHTRKKLLSSKEKRKYKVFEVPKEQHR